MIKVINGDILTAPTGSILIHQVNCQNVMGSGVAKALFTKYPLVKKQYHTYCSRKGRNNLLGTYDVVITQDYHIVNMFSQFTYGRVGLHTSYDAFRKALTDIFGALPMNARVAMPYGIGCGLAGGDWNTIFGIIGAVSNSRPDVEVVLYRI